MGFKSSSRCHRRRRCAAAPPSYRPWSCCVLAVDPGEHCGVSVFCRGAYVDSGMCDGFDVQAIERWVANARYFAQAVRLPLVLVLEKPPKGGAAFAGRSPAGPASVMGCRKLWRRTWQRMDVVTRLRCDVYPVTWRSQVLAITRGPLLERNEALRARLLAGRVLGSHDEAVAVLIGEWGSHAAVVGELLQGGSRRARKPVRTSDAASGQPHARETRGSDAA